MTGHVHVLWLGNKGKEEVKPSARTANVNTFAPVLCIDIYAEAEHEFVEPAIMIMSVIEICQTFMFFSF